MSKRFSRTCVLVFCCALLVMLSGCLSPVSSEPATPTSTAPVIQESTPASEAERGPSGTLRLWWDQTQTVHPLQMSSESGRAVYSLVFGQLFQKDANWQLQPELIQDYSFSSDRLQLTLALKPDNHFQDGSLLTASDVLATLSAIQALGTDSPYAAALQAYSSGRLISPTTLVLQLSQVDPGFLHALTFPVLKADEITWPAGSSWQGTRSYRLGEQTEAGLTLALTATGTMAADQLPEILVKTYRSATEAMRGLEDDQLDLVLLPTADLYHYQMRGSLRLERFNSPTYSFFSFGQDVDSVTAQTACKYFLRAKRWSQAGKSWPGQLSEGPLPAFHACFAGQAFDLESAWPAWLEQNSLSSEQPVDWPVFLSSLSQPVRIVAPMDQTYLVDMANQAGTWLTQAGLTVEVTALPAQEFVTVLSSGDYGLAFQTADLPASAEPGWYLEIPVAVAEGLPDNNENRYDEDQGNLAVGWPFFDYLGYGLPQDESAVAEISRQYRQVLTQALLTAPKGGILLGEAAIAYGDRVIGQCQPMSTQPYLGIEEIWIWSGS